MLLVLLLSSIFAMPNPALTPGVVRPMTVKELCAVRWGRDHRAVTTAMKRHVVDAYGIPWVDHGRYEIDHLISRELAGADDERNLYPQCCIVKGRIVGPAHEKDVLENRLHARVCRGEMSLHEAQEALRVDWMAAAKRYPGSKAK